MIVFKRVLLCFILIIALMGCEHEHELAERNYPRIETLTVTDITEKGVTLNAAFSLRGDFEITQYGFCWSTNKGASFSNCDRIINNDNIRAETFSIDVRRALERGKKYYVRAFVETKDYFVIGFPVSFESEGSGAPVIESVSPGYAAFMDTVVITGSRFSYLAYAHKVTVGGRLAYTLEATDKELKVMFPSGAKSENKLTVTLAGKTTTYDKPIYKTAPEVTAVFPREVSFDDTIYIEGNHFCWSPNYNIIQMGDSKLLVLSADKTHLTARVPQSIETVENELTVSVDGEQVSCGTITLKAPVVQSVSPALLTDPQQLQVTLTGDNFHPVEVNNQVLIGGEAAEVISATYNELVVAFPQGLIPEQTAGYSATYDVEVTLIGQTTTLAGGVSLAF